MLRAWSFSFASLVGLLPRYRPSDQFALFLRLWMHSSMRGTTTGRAGAPDRVLLPRTSGWVRDPNPVGARRCFS
jgi:hypothetical protein